MDVGLKEKTRQHSSRMHTKPWKPYKFQFQLQPLDVAPGGGRERWVGPEMNKFEQVSSDHYQMSLAGGLRVARCGYIQGAWDGMGMSRGAVDGYV